MKHTRPARWLALILALVLVTAPAAQAISVEEARDLLSQTYIDPIPEEILDLPTIGEITDALGDPYTYYMTPEEYQAFQKELNDTTVIGVGAKVEYTTNGLVIISIAPDSPLAKSGLKVGDIIVGVDDTTLEQAGSSEALGQLVPGEAGTKVKITALQDGEKLTRTLTRAEVVFPTATGEVVDGHIGWLNVTSFGENTGDYFEQYITEENAEADRWVVDLRDNAGGYGAAVIQALGYIIGNQNQAYLVDNQQQVEPWRSSVFPFEIPALIDEPMIVIVNAASASASELFAAAVKDYGAALIIGERTFGKGVAQDVFEMEDGSVFKITTSRYYSPNWYTPDRSGVLPQLVVAPGLAPDVARLLSGKAAVQAGGNVLNIHLAGQTWYVHKEEAVSEAYAPAFAQLLAAITPGTAMTLNGKAVTPEEVSRQWKVDYESRYFDDVSDSPWADEINTLAALGMVFGDEEGKFKPEGELTRAELCAIVAQAMGFWSWKSEGGAPFADVAEDAWYATAVDILYDLGLIQGNDEGSFDPDALIDHQQFMTILARVAARIDLTARSAMEKAPTEEAMARPDAAAFDAWARPAALTLEDLGVLLTDLDEAEPSAVTTRAEAAAMLYNLLSYTGIYQAEGSLVESPAA